MLHLPARSALLASTGLSPSLARPSNRLGEQIKSNESFPHALLYFDPPEFSKNYNSNFFSFNKFDFNFELLHLHSPLLMKSLLFSFPEVIDMLKFAS